MAATFSVLVQNVTIYKYEYAYDTFRGPHNFDFTQKRHKMCRAGTWSV